MTNPDNAVGTNAAYGGRTSVNAFNDDLGAYTRGVLSGWACTPDTGLTVTLGGDGNTRDVAIAEDAAGNKTTINNRSNSPISLTIGAAPASNTRIDAIVAYVDASPQGSATITDNYEACGLITVQGTASSTPVAPNESAIRTAITADGASGATAYYVVLAYISIASGTTDITANQITAVPTSMKLVDDIANYLNLSNFTTPTLSLTNLTYIGSSTNVGCAANADGSLGKVYGQIRVKSSATSWSISFPTPLRPAETMTVNGIVMHFYNDVDAGGSDSWVPVPKSITIATDGTATITDTQSLANRQNRIFLSACLIFAKSFGDSQIIE